MVMSQLLASTVFHPPGTLDSDFHIIFYRRNHEGGPKRTQWGLVPPPLISFVEVHQHTNVVYHGTQNIHVGIAE